MGRWLAMFKVPLNPIARTCYRVAASLCLSHTTKILTVSSVRKDQLVHQLESEAQTQRGGRKLQDQSSTKVHNKKPILFSSFLWLALIISQEEHSDSTGGWSAAIFIIYVEVAKRFAYFGMAGNLITYLTNEIHEPIPIAVKNVNTWVGVSSLLPILGAFIADAFLGRFNTIFVSSTIYRLEAIFFVALYILSIGLAGHKPCVQTFAVDQFREDMPRDKKVKSSFFNWWFLGIVIGASVAILVVIYVQDYVWWAAGFGVLTGAMAVALVLFLFGYKKYKAGTLRQPFHLSGSGVCGGSEEVARQWNTHWCCCAQ